MKESNSDVFTSFDLILFTNMWLCNNCNNDVNISDFILFQQIYYIIT